MTTQGYATASKAARDTNDIEGLIARFYPFTEEGYLDAYNHAKANGYDIWETNGKELHALIYRARDVVPDDLHVAAIKSGKITKGPKLLAELFNRR